MTLAIPVSSSIEMKMNPLAVPGRCRAITQPPDVAILLGPTIAKGGPIAVGDYPGYFVSDVADGKENSNWISLSNWN
jgi:hypothetical protein